MTNTEKPVEAALPRAFSSTPVLFPADGSSASMLVVVDRAVANELRGSFECEAALSLLRTAADCINSLDGSGAVRATRQALALMALACA